MAADTLNLRLVGRIAAGEPVFSAELIERSLRVPKWFFKLKPDYLVHVVGDSMRDEVILTEELVEIHATRVARHGQIVAARTGGERFIIKRLH